MTLLWIGLSLWSGWGGAPAWAWETDLGTEGNAWVQKEATEWERRYRLGLEQGCQSVDPEAQRILISGFGPYSGDYRNLSALVVESLSLPGFLPETFQTWSSRSPAVLPELKGGLGGIASAPLRAQQRLLKIGKSGAEKKIELCLVELQVQWDLAAYALLRVIDDFRPQKVLMLGQSAVSYRMTLERWAQNQTVGSPGFSGEGRKTRWVSPRSSWSLPPRTAGVDPVIGLKVSASRAYQLFDTLREPWRQGWSELPNLRVEETVGGRGRDNTFICNQLAYLVAEGVSGTKVELAGGQLVLQLVPNTEKPIEVSFVHLPLVALRDRSSKALWPLSQWVLRLLLPDHE